MQGAVPSGIPSLPGINAPVVLGSAAGSSNPQGVLRIGAGDLILIQVFDAQELSSVVRVALNGTVSLPLVGSVKVAGLTPTEAADEIANLLKAGKFITNPAVTIFIEEYATQGVSILGEVRTPGLYPAVGPRMLLDLLAQAGGANLTASSEITIRRRDGTEQQIHLDMTGSAKEMLASNIDINPGDTVIVPRIGVVYVIGEVVRPGGYIMQDSGNLTVLQAIALAQGHTTLASLNHAIILHREPGHQTVQTDVPVKKIMEGRVHDIALQTNDVLYLPRNIGKEAAFIALEDGVRGLYALAYYTK
jgi:polysaccharide export outer membrane protein